MSNDFLLFSDPSDALNLYRAELHRLDVGHDWVISLHDIRTQLSRNAYHGVLIELPSRMRADELDRDFVQELEGYFPATNLQFNPAGEKIRCASPKWMGGSFEDFIRTNLELPARKIRNETRQSINLNVIVHDRDQERRVNTVDLSPSGCFIWDPVPMEPGMDVELVFDGFSDQVVRATVVWIRNWGQKRRPCGYSLRFKNNEKALVQSLVD